MRPSVSEAARTSKALKFVKVYDFQTDDIGGIDQQAIIAACNAGDHPRNAEHRSLAADMRIDVGIKAFFMKRRDAKDPKRAVTMPAASRPLMPAHRSPSAVSAAPSHADAPPKPVSVDIRVAEKGNTCPKDAEVTAYIDYEKPMTGRFQVVHNGKPGETIEIKAREVSFAGKTWYRIERARAL